MLPAATRQKLKDEILGEAYELSFAFVDSRVSHALNKQYRDKDRPTNVLSFPLTPNAGEILIDQELAASEAASLEQTMENYVLFLFIHGLLHLKGLDHGSTMEAEEQRILSRFISTHHAQTHRRRPRHRKLIH
jgi:probable rRNA maturation factor